ncbi:MAG: mannose-6-phosphate isomerase [Bryobacterales bacterium]|nr:mannose-6-phosphate isomerase [Bryobacterales bacterium]
MPSRMENGEELTRDESEKNIDSLLAELRWESHPEVSKGTASEEENAVRCLCCECPYFRLDRVETRRVGLMSSTVRLY